MPRATRLTVQDWTTAGVTALLEGGPKAVSIEGVATRLGATKGSGYWHFRSRDALLEAVVAEFVQAHTERIIATAEAAGPDPEVRLRALFAVVFNPRRGPHEARVLLSDEPVIATAVAHMAERRIAYVADVVASSGVPPREARHRAELAYCIVVGHEALVAASPASLTPMPRGRALADRVVALLLR